MLWSYVVPVAIALVAMWIVAWLAQPLPWSPDKPVTSLQRALETSIFGILLGFAFIGLAMSRKLDGQPEAPENVLAIAGLTVTSIGAVVGLTAVISIVFLPRRSSHRQSAKGGLRDKQRERQPSIRP